MRKYMQGTGALSIVDDQTRIHNFTVCESEVYTQRDRRERHRQSVC